MSAFSRLRGLPSASHSSECLAAALGEEGAASTQQVDPGSSAASGDVSALALLRTLRTPKPSDPLELEAACEATYAMTPWSSRSSDRYDEDAAGCAVLFVDEGREVASGEGGSEAREPLAEGERLHEAHEAHAEQLQALVNAFGGRGEGEASVQAGGEVDEALGSKLEGLLGRLQRCRATLHSQQSREDGEGAGEEGAGENEESKEEEETGENEKTKEEGETEEEDEESDGCDEEHEEVGTCGLLLRHFPVHIGELFSMDGAELKELAVNRLHAHLTKCAAAAAGESHAEGDLYGAAEAAEAEAEAAEDEADAPPRFWARAVPLDPSERVGGGDGDSDDLGGGGWTVASSREAEGRGDGQLLAACWMLRDALMEPHGRVVCAALLLLQHDSPLLTATLHRCTRRGVRRALPLLIGPLLHTLAASSVRVATGAANALTALLVHPRSCAALLLPQLYAEPLGEALTAERRLRLLLHLLGGSSQLRAAELDLSRPSTASRPATALGSTAAWRGATAEVAPAPAALALLQRGHAGSPGSAIRGVLRLCGEGLRRAEAAVRQAAVELLMQACLVGVDHLGIHLRVKVGLSLVHLCRRSRGRRMYHFIVPLAFFTQVDAVSGDSKVEIWLAQEPPLPLLLHADLESRLRSTRLLLRNPILR
ncbi:hypothetical protein AB1Y20_018530 [Prymnesium parvum]|uniref:HEAT repeat-containing protein 1 n=1 Tax=Prymnesium parvum TaxID=97485 RepID=A0AB34JPH2_PRYPA